MSGPITRDELVELIAGFEAIFEAQAIEGAGKYDVGLNGDDDDARAFGVDIEDTGEPGNTAFAQALGERFICALDDGTIAAWGARKPMPSGWVSRELVFFPPEEQVLA